MNSEVAMYNAELRELLDKLCSALDGLNGEQLNRRPQAAGANSLYAILAHVLGNMDAWVLGIACDQPRRRDRPAEFASSGPDLSHLVPRAHELAKRMEEALSALPSDALDAVRAPTKELWGESDPRPITAREALMHTVEHAAIHLGQIHITKDLLAAEAAV